jgi:hypothetical protein
MKYWSAKVQAEYCAREYKATYYMIKARNGQWMVESAKFLESPTGKQNYPETRERVQFDPPLAH